MIKLGPEHVVFALSYNILDLVHDTLGDLKQAKDWHEWAPDIYLKKISDLGMLILQRLTITWVLYIVSWMTYRGQKTVRCAPWLFTWKKLGPEHVKVTTSYHNLRLGHWKVGDLQQGKESHEFALDEIFGPKHVKVADIYKNLGAVHIDQGYFHEAQECYDRAFAIYDKNVGPQDGKLKWKQNQNLPLTVRIFT